MGFPIGGKWLEGRWLHRIISVLAALLAAALLPACSVMKIAYNQAPDLAYWQLDSYLDLSSEQSLQTKARLRQLHAWHRTTQLPAYAALLQRLQSQLPFDTTPAQVCSVAAEVRDKFTVILRQAEPTVAALGRQLEEPQRKRLAKKMAKNNAEETSERAGESEKARNDKRFELALERAERLYGPLGAAQQLVLSRRLDLSRPDELLQASEKQRRQRDLLATIQPMAASQTSLDEALVAVHGWVERSLQSPDPAYRAYVLQLTQDSCHTIAELHNSTTAVQRSRAAQTLRRYGDDLQALIATPGSN